jgi:hypothetical protein
MVDVTGFISEISINVEDVKAILPTMREATVLPLEHNWKSFTNQRDGMVDKKLHLYVQFLGKTRPIDLKERNVARLASAFGSEKTEDWTGKKFGMIPSKRGAVEWIEVKAL